MKKLILTTLGIIFINLVNAQFVCTCLPEGITFETQSQIDSFQINYPNCTKIMGDVTIDGDNIVNLTGLNVITSITGNFLIGNPNVHTNPDLVNLAGMENLISVGGDLDIKLSRSLTSLIGLNNLTSVGGSLNYFHNISLINMAGLENLTTVAGNFNSFGNNVMTSLTGLDNLISVGGTIKIHNADALTNLEGLDNLVSIGGSLQLKFNDELTTLSGLLSLTTIGGSLIIGDDDFWEGNPSLNNLTGLDNLASVGRDIIIKQNNALASLTGLNNLESIGRHLIIYSNDTLINLTGLDQLSTIGGKMFISGNHSLESLVGCNNITNLGGSLIIDYNNELTDFYGLSNLIFVGGSLDISRNYGLTDLEGLNSLAEIGGDLVIENNDVLTNLTGLDNLIVIGGDLNISSNTQLDSCSINALCNYISSPNGVITIHDNAVGCSSIIEIAMPCGIAFPCLEEGYYQLTSQLDVDYFPLVYPGCSDLKCDVSIGPHPFSSGTDITNLDSLGVINSIQGSLSIQFNNSLCNLTGLENLTFIGSGLNIGGNDSLNSLSGLEGIVSIGKNLNICTTTLENGIIFGNPLLTSIEALANLTNIGTELRIQKNTSLKTLAGIEGIDPGSITALNIKGNSLLSTCEVQSICDHLAAPVGNVEIKYNAPGCNSTYEVEEACLQTSIGEQSSISEISISPNPVKNYTILQIDIPKNNPVNFSLYNNTGICIKTWQYTSHHHEQKETQMDLRDVPVGLYICRIQIGNEVVTKKIIKL